jgi:hypothetical protein
LGCTQFGPFVELRLDRVFALAQHIDQHHHEPAEPHDLFEVMVRFVFFHLDELARRLWVDQPRLLVVGKLMVNAALTPQRHFQAPA